MTGAYIYIADSEKESRRGLSEFFEEKGYRVVSALSGEEALKRLKKGRPRLLFLGLQLSDMDGLALLKRLRREGPCLPVIVMVDSEQRGRAVEAMKLGAHSYVLKPIDFEEVHWVAGKSLMIEDWRRQAEGIRVHQQLMCEKFGAFQASQGLKRIYQKAAELGSSDHAPVLVVGEDGTGKELLAHVIHVESPRCGFPFVPVSGHLPAKRLEDELFGSPEGFHPQGGKKKVGRLQQADGGTLYIRCIEEMERSAQLKLARFLARQELKEVGGEDRHSLDVRVIAGARTELKTVVRQGKFLEELYRHLSPHVLPLSPLRDSPRDIVPLATHFGEQFSREYGKRVTRFDVEAQRWLRTYAWPGNLGELRSVVERAVLLSEGGVLSKSALNSSLSCEKINLGSIFEDGYLISLDEMEKLYIHTVLKAVRNNKTKASKVLGVSRNTLKSKLAESGSSSSPRRRAASRRRR